MSGEAYAGRSKIRMLLGDAVVEQLHGRVVIDFGCGTGGDSIELARSGAARVIGVDIQERLLEIARTRAREAGVADVCEFTMQPQARADAIVSLDAFEHFSDPSGVLTAMRQMLKPDGFVAVSFGPTWYHPLGGHLFSVFPWAHLMFSERALLRWRSDFKSDGATRFHEVTGGLNQLTIGAFERIVAASPFTIESLACVPIRKLRPVHSRWTREFTTALVRAVLRPRQAERTPASNSQK